MSIRERRSKYPDQLNSGACFWILLLPSFVNIRALCRCRILDNQNNEYSHYSDVDPVYEHDITRL